MLIRGNGLTVEDVHRVAVLREKVQIDEDNLKMVQDACDRVQRWGTEDQPIYGVTTGFGEMINMIIPAKYETELQENLLRSHAAGAGPVFPDEVVRAMLVSRANCLSKGYSGISADALRLIAGLLNHNIHPVVPQQGSLGASGDLAPLAHLALPLIGAGRVRYRGEVVSSASALAAAGLKPVKLGYKDGLALINGTSGMTAAASLALVRAERLLRLAIWSSATFTQVLRGSTRPFEQRAHVLKNHRGQTAVAKVIRQLLAGSELTREHADIMHLISASEGVGAKVVEVSDYLQNAYSVRCTPQILGPVVDATRYCRRIVEEELNSCNDNPLIFESPETVFHGGHFHGQYVAMCSDFLNIAITEIGVLAERQLNRLLDPRLNGTYPAFLALGEQGLYSGLEGAQYLATSIASENLDLAAPASVKTIPSNGQNQDIVSMGLIAARKSLQLVDNVHAIVSVLVTACYQAATITGIERFSTGVRGLLSLLAEKLPAYRDVAHWPSLPPAGTPVPGVSVHVVDTSLHEQPEGVEGELCFGGFGLARGYLNDSLETAKLFVPDPFTDRAGARLYHTGDWARVLPSGEIEVLGRIDDQVKIRGFRVEPHEVETTLMQCPDVAEAVVVAVGDAQGWGSKRLIAYLRSTGDADGQTGDHHQASEFLRAKLPDYMIPDAFVRVSSFPLTPHGKIDRRALPAPRQPGTGKQYDAPRDDVEMRIAEIWAEVLRTDRVGRTDDFFEIGGDSVTALQAVARMRASEVMTITVRQLYEWPTIEQLALRRPSGDRRGRKG